MIGCDNPIAMIDVDVKFERQMSQEKLLYIFTSSSLKFRFSLYSFILLCSNSDSLTKVWWWWWLWETADSTDCAKQKNPFVCNLKPRWRVEIKMGPVGRGPSKQWTAFIPTQCIWSWLTMRGAGPRCQPAEQRVGKTWSPMQCCLEMVKHKPENFWSNLNIAFLSDT